MEQILIEGLKQALARGQSLQQAMESFYYAGYPKEEIEKAAKVIQGAQINPVTERKKQEVKKLITNKKSTPVQKVSNYPAKQVKPKPQQLVKAQKISEYKRQKTRPGLDWILILMLFGLFGLVGALLFMLLK